MVFLAAVSHSETRRSWFGIALVLLLLLVACGENMVRGDEALLEGTVILDCGQDCKDYGSCGRTADSDEEVLLLGSRPAFPHVSEVEFKGLMGGIAVEVQETKNVSGIIEGTGEEVEIRFYLVNQSQADMTGWIPGFCLVQSQE